MKKVLALILAVGMVIGMCACGSGSGKVKGETFDTGVISVLVPDGWMKKDVVFDEEVDKTQIQLFKGAKSDDDIWVTPYVSVKHYYPEENASVDNTLYFYEDVETLDDVTIGDITWNASKGSFGGTEQIILSTGTPTEYIIFISTDVAGNTLSLDDADVQAIISSITVTAEQ